jgi:hypothetical protein
METNQSTALAQSPPIRSNPVLPITDMRLLNKFVYFFDSTEFYAEQIDASKLTIENCRKALELFK